MTQSSSCRDPLRGQVVNLRPGVQLQVCHTLGRDPALVFLHGGLGNRFNWRSQYEFACAQGWQALVYDLAGHGQSESYPRYSLGRHCRDLKRLLHRFEIDSPVLCCHSYGVPIGLEWAQRHSIRALVAIGGGTHELAPWWEIPLMKALNWGGRHLYRIPGVQNLTNALSSSHKHETIQQFFAESPVPLTPHAYRALEIFWGYNFFARRKKHWDPQVPVLVISGGEDPMFTPAMGAELAACFPRGQHLNFPAAGHLVMAEYPDQVNQAIANLRGHL